LQGGAASLAEFVEGRGCGPTKVASLRETAFVMIVAFIGV